MGLWGRGGDSGERWGFREEAGLLGKGVASGERRGYSVEFWMLLLRTCSQVDADGFGR